MRDLARDAQFFLAANLFVVCSEKIAAVAAYRTRVSSLLHLILTHPANTKRDFCDRATSAFRLSVITQYWCRSWGDRQSTPIRPTHRRTIYSEQSVTGGNRGSGHISSTSGSPEMIATIEELRSFSGAVRVVQQ